MRLVKASSATRSGAPHQCKREGFLRRIGSPAVAALGCVLITTVFGVPVFTQASFNTSYQTTDFSGEWTTVGGEIPLCPHCRAAAPRDRLHGRVLRLLRTAL